MNEFKAKRIGLASGAACIALATLAFAASPGHAQEAEAAANAAAAEQTGDDIVVTALKRNMSLQDTPATVSVVSGETISKVNITSALDLPAITPGVMIQAGPGALSVAAIRGIGSNASNQSFDQSVALFVDGVFTARGRDYAASLFDVENIQVIKGGQSAVLGKNTTVGAIALTTRKPEFRFGYSLSYSHEYELGSDTIDGTVNIPLSDTFAIRAAGRVADLGGWAKNDLTGEVSPRVNTRAGRIALRWQPSDALEWNLSYQRESYRAKGVLLYVAGDSLGRVAAYAAAAGDPNFTAAFNDHYRASPRPGFPDDNIHNSSHRAISTIDYSLGDGYDLTAITSYFKSDGDFLSNTNAVINAPVYLSSDRGGDKTFSQEIRLTTPRIGAFEFILGGLYYHNIYNFNIGFDAVAPTVLVGAEDTQFRQKTVDWSGFVAATAHISDKLSLNGAVRYTTEDRTADYSRTIIRPGSLINAIYRPFAPTTLSRSQDYLDGSISAQYQFTPDVMAYVSYGKGSKSGGFANAPNDPNALRPDGTRAAEYDDEVAKTFEAGLKLGQGSRTHLNVAYFNVTVDQFQTSLFSGTTFIVKNIDIRSRGVELEAVWRATDALSFSLNGTYADAINKSPAANERRPLVRAPKWSGIGSVTYSQDVSDALRFTADANVEFRSGFWFQDALTSTVPKTDSYAKLGLRVGLEHAESGIEIALLGRNLTDKRVPNYGTGMFPPMPGAWAGSSEPPRTIALQLTVRR